MSDSAPADAAAHCADLVRTHDFARYAATLFVGPEARRGLLALYAFNVEICRVRDVVSQPLPGEIRLQWWTDLLEGAGHGGVEGNPVAAELLLAVRQFGLDTGRLSRLVDEHQFDLYHDPMPTLAALEGYADATTGVLFAQAARIMGPATAEVEHLARHAGLAQGFVQVVLGLPRDSASGQLFVPEQLLATHGVTAAQLFARQSGSPVRAALGELLSAARDHLTTSMELLSHVSPAVRRAFLPLALVSHELGLLQQTARDPFVPQPVSRLRVLWTLWRASRSRAFGG